MNIKKRSKDTFTKLEQYKLIEGETVKMADSVGMVIKVDSWIIYDDVNSRGENVEILAILAEDGRVYATISKTFKDRFLRIVEIFGVDDMPAILITGGESKSGREYVSCTAA